MSHTDTAIEIRKPVEFTIDGRSYKVTGRWQPAANLLILAGLDPTQYDLGELRRNQLHPVRYESTDMVGIRRGARFVSLPRPGQHDVTADGEIFAVSGANLAGPWKAGSMRGI
jgi:hypothetical protein